MIQLFNCKDEYPALKMINRANEYTENYNTPVVAKDLPTRSQESPLFH